MVKEIGNNGEGNRGEGYLSQRDKGLLLDREEIDVAREQMSVFKGKKGNSVLE